LHNSEQRFVLASIKNIHSVGTIKTVKRKRGEMEKINQNQ